MLSLPLQIRAQQVFNAGGLIAYPTEAVYGVGCDPFNPDAVMHLLALKQRDWRKGLIVLVDSFNALSRLIEPLGGAQWERLHDSWPGPITYLIPANTSVPHWVRGTSDKIAVRYSAHPIAQALCHAVGGVLISTSLNIAGEPPVRSALHAQKQWGNAVDLIIPGATGGQKNPTQIKDLMTDECIRPS
ncbi:MAG TPA: Sua5/YciO/YrdC/YwlC family protein [Pseudomonadales bacterium]|nr:Sua5/YciO/YrdC/YwlC family protein [Pseudomonadales bacterium]